ncbi:MAG: nuclear transport factor 2 family protein [Candidatus Limnocylindria bacterium]
MSVHPNAARIRGLFQAFHDRDLAAIQAAIPEHAVWHFPGRKGGLAGSHQGRDAILAFLGQVVALSGGSFRLELEDVIASDTSAAVFFRGSGSRAGRTLDNPTCLRIRIENGRIVEVWEFVWDLYAVDEFWA